MKIEIEVKDLNIPELYEFAGEYRRVKKGEFYLRSPGRVRFYTDNDPTEEPFFVLRRKEWRPINTSDLEKLLQGPLDCLTTDIDGSPFESKLIGFMCDHDGEKFKPATLRIATGQQYPDLSFMRSMDAVQVRNDQEPHVFEL